MSLQNEAEVEVQMQSDATYRRSVAMLEKVSHCKDLDRVIGIPDAERVRVLRHLHREQMSIEWMRQTQRKEATKLGGRNSGIFNDGSEQSRPRDE